MNDLFLGNYIAGNFSPKESVSKGAYTLEKRDGVLCLMNGRKVIPLTPIDDDAKIVVHNFSSDIEFNESIYDIQFSGENIVVILYTYSTTQKLLRADQKISIHLLREAEKQICSDDGYEGHAVDSTKDIVSYLTDLFINNKSIFVHLDTKNPDAFQMFGKNGIRVNVKRERAGVYCIDRFYRTRNKDYSFDLTQLYGNIEFVLWQDSISISGVGAARLEAVKTNEVFRAWNEYMDFEKRVYEDELRERGVIRYDAIETDGDQLVFTLSEAITDDQINGIEFEFYSAFSGEGGRALPKSTEELILLKQTDARAGIYLGKVKNEGSVTDKLVFDIPRFGYIKEMERHSGIIYVSDHSIQVEQRRRKRVLKAIESKQNESSNIIMKLSKSDVVDDQLGTTYGPTNADVLRKMFGNPNIVLKETYREAMFIALNTPDIALIQGPPGTGKTTLINGLIARLNGMNENYRILVSSEQHEALKNVVEKLSKNKQIPPFVSSRRFDSDSNQEDAEQFEKNVLDFQKNFIALCNDLLRDGNIKERRSAKITALIYEIQKIRDNGYSANYILSVIDKLKTQVIELGGYDKLSADFLTLEQIVKLPTKGTDIEDTDFATRQIIRKIESQRTDIDVFLEDDGERQLQDLQRILKRNEYDDLCLDENVVAMLLSGEDAKVREVFDKYVEYVTSLKDKFLLTRANEFDEDNSQSAKDIIEKIAAGISELTKSAETTFFDIVEGLAFKLGDIDNAAGIISKYTTIVGSTCAQAEKIVDLMELRNDRYDYVIIDEAARANPLDIMIPMMMGTKVILIGDHKQLPHYIETKYVDKFKKEKEQYSEYDEKLLTKSLFQIIYENLEKAYKEGRIKFKRTIQIDEQHRMHPTIGSFISREFYEGTIQNGERTVNNKNDYHIFDGKNVVWIDMPIFKGAESSFAHSYARECEAERIIEIIPTDKLRAFTEHPYKIIDNDEMASLIESIKAQGVLTPIVVRPMENGEYEIVSGHRRVFACNKLGIFEVPAVVRELTREEAIVVMADSNLHRDGLLPSEKAFAYKMKLDAIKRQGERTDLTSDHRGQKSLTSVERIALESDESKSQVQRYIALTNLIPEFLQMVDEGKMALTPAVEISRLPIEAQKMLHRECELCDCTPSYSQTVRMRKINEVRELTWHDLAEIMSEEKANQKEKVTLFMDDLKKYYPRSATPKDIAADIMKMLESRYKARRNRDAR